MKKYLVSALVFAAVVWLTAAAKVAPPKPVGPLPSPAQLAWQQLEYYAFAHFGMNTFTDHEWGEGRAQPDNFNPTQFDARQWARVVKAAGMRGIIITAKHHDGFCLWPSATTEYTVKQAKWRDGQGDVLKDLSAACQEAGLKFGVYISPWDRNHPLYGTPKYNGVYKAQWRELLSNYGPVFESWLDGANDGKKRMVYDFWGFFSTIKGLQPNTIIFSDAGPDIRWVGNEKGFAGETNWSPRENEGTFPGFADEKQLNVGDENGTTWLPAECDVSLRPGWFYHANEDEKLKSVEQLLSIYYGSVGRNANLLLNIGVDRRGLVNENDERRLLEFKQALDREFANKLTPAKITATNVRGNSAVFSAAKATDADANSYWATDDGVTAAALELDFGREVEFNRFMAQEQIALGQRVKKFSLQIWQNGAYETIAQETTIGYKRLLRFPAVKTSKLKFMIEAAKACPVINNVAVYLAP
ncbi:MAG: alpha-L-fucosidase [Acidobacteria bacterium]|nr:alpha-L-fucosidase [Acidobacteriota bacterium]MBI3422325.1 alpha-L-fucosidase [Acidobacteriota bacterium]